MPAAKSVLDVIVYGDGNLAEGVFLDVLRSDLSVNANLALRAPIRTIAGTVSRIEEAGERAYIEVDGTRWQLHRRDVVQAGGLARFPWKIVRKW